MTTKKNLSADVFANFAAKREAEQKEIEKVGVFGEHTSVTEEDIPIAEEVVIEETDPVEIAAEAGVMEDVTEDLSDIVFEELESETNKKSVGRPRGRKAKKEPVYHLTVNLPVSKAKGLKIMAIENGTNVSRMIEQWYDEHK